MANLFQEMQRRMGIELRNEKSGRKIRKDWQWGFSNTSKYKKKEGGILGNIKAIFKE